MSEIHMSRRGQILYWPRSHDFAIWSNGQSLWVFSFFWFSSSAQLVKVVGFGSFSVNMLLLYQVSILLFMVYILPFLCFFGSAIIRRLYFNKTLFLDHIRHEPFILLYTTRERQPLWSFLSVWLTLRLIMLIAHDDSVKSAFK